MKENPLYLKLQGRSTRVRGISLNLLNVEEYVKRFRVSSWTKIGLFLGDSS